MPAVSERQRRAMWAAANGKSTLGIPQEVGKEFVSADAFGASIAVDSGQLAAGILYSTPQGKHLLAKRGDGARDFPGAWSVPGGMVEPGESLKDAAIREFREETGGEVDPEAVVHLGNIGNFGVFHVVGDAFDPTGDGENSAFQWADTLPTNDTVHPELYRVFSHPEVARVGANELQLARMLADGSIESPQIYGNQYLFPMRITGTGVCYRKAADQFAWRDPAEYLTDEFMARCNGLPVVWEHPADGTLNTEEFQQRVVGSVLLPYVSGSEVWGIAKLYDASVAEALVTEQLSTSPSVVTIGDALLTLADGSDIVMEGKPKLIDHLAICKQGVWDKGGKPEGVTTNHEVTAMADEDALSKIMDSLEGLSKRIDSIEGKKADAEKEEAEAKAKADAEAKEKADAEEKAKADAEKAKADADIASKIADLEKRIPGALSDAEANAMADAQAKADSVFGAFGESAPRPVAGESVDGYRRRVASKLKSHSKAWANVDLAKADSEVLAIAEAAIYADALAAGSAPATVGEGRIIMRTRRTDSGHIVREPVGDNAAYLASFSSKPGRLAGIRRA